MLSERSGHECCGSQLICDPAVAFGTYSRRTVAQLFCPHTFSERLKEVLKQRGHEYTAHRVAFGVVFAHT